MHGVCAGGFSTKLVLGQLVSHALKLKDLVVRSVVSVALTFPDLEVGDVNSGACRGRYLLSARLAIYRSTLIFISARPLNVHIN